MATTTACRWCGEPASERRVVIPADVNHRTKETRRAAVEADVCERHAAFIDREFRRLELERDVRSLGPRIARLHEKSPRRAVLVAQLGRGRLELAELLEGER